MKKENKILVAYFSHSGNTKVIANQIKDILGCDTFEIQTEKPYPKEYDVVVKIAKQEHEEDSRPKLIAKVDNIQLYDIVFIGYPMWWYTVPMSVATFLTQYDFSGKNIIPFCTHEGSGLSNSEEDIKKFCPKSNVKKGLAIRGSYVSKAKTDVNNWLKELNII
jgi:flavodoxin